VALTLPLLLLVLLRQSLSVIFCFQNYEVVTNAAREARVSPPSCRSAVTTTDEAETRATDYLTCGWLEAGQARRTPTVVQSQVAITGTTKCVHGDDRHRELSAIRFPFLSGVIKYFSDHWLRFRLRRSP
jgi:hypothetical protein